MPSTFYVNTDFDISLRPRGIERAVQSRQVRELTVQALLGATAADAALLRVEVPPEFLTYLTDQGVEVPRCLVHPHVDHDTTLDPFGWNDEAISLNRVAGRPASHPEIACVRRVNSRSFGRKLEAELHPDTPPVIVARDVDELEARLAGAPPGGWVVKSEFGNAALGNRRIRGAPLGPADRRWVEARLAEDDRLVVEPWLERTHDWSVVFRVPFEERTLRVHEVISTRSGSLIGALFDPSGEPPGAPLGELERMARRVATRLDEEGYSGPVCVDAFAWRDGDATKLRPLVDLNCRHALSDPVHRLWRRLAPERAVLYRFFRLDKLRLPGDLAGTVATLGAAGFDTRNRTGVLLASPLLVRDEETWRGPTKLGVLFLGTDREDVLAREHAFRRRFESGKPASP